MGWNQKHDFEIAFKGRHDSNEKGGHTAGRNLLSGVSRGRPVPFLAPEMWLSRTSCWNVVALTAWRRAADVARGSRSDVESFRKSDGAQSRFHMQNRSNFSLKMLK